MDEPRKIEQDVGQKRKVKIKMPKRMYCGLRNVEVYWRKMLPGFIPWGECFHTA